MLSGVIAFGGISCSGWRRQVKFRAFPVSEKVSDTLRFSSASIWCRLTPLIVRRRPNNDYAGIFNTKGAGSHATYLLSDFQESTLVGPNDERTACVVSISGWRQEGLQASGGRGGDRSAGVSRIRHRWTRCGF